MITREQHQSFELDGYLFLEGFFTDDDLAAGLAELEHLYPTAEGFHAGSDERAARFVGDQFAGIEFFPLKSQALNQLCVHPKLVALARTLLGAEDLRMSSAEAWAKYTGAVDYDQQHHLDFMSHTTLVPSDAPAFRQLELFIYLSDVDADLGPTHVVSRQNTSQLPLAPNWRSREEAPELFAAEVAATGRRGTVLAYTTGTTHRGSNMTRPGGARFTMHINFRRAEAEWGQRVGWADRSFDPLWVDFVVGASVEQLLLFGFPVPGHPFWTEATCIRMRQRYPGFRTELWQGRS